MDNKELYLKFIKDFNNIGINNICKKINKDVSTFYTYKYSLENMQDITDHIRNEIIKFYPVLKNDFILNTKEKNIEFVKKLAAIQIKKICLENKIDLTTIYSKKASEKKYKIVIDEINLQLQQLFNYFKNS